MPDLSYIDQISERVERLLVRYEELTRTNALLNLQIDTLTLERDSLKSRLNAARARVDALLERLPEDSASAVLRPAFKTTATSPGATRGDA
jgi:cell division protein ZapB